MARACLPLGAVRAAGERRAGFDAAGKQVWGAVKGPYVFVRRTPL